MTFCAALDYSWTEASFAVVEKGAGTVFDRSLPLSGKNAAELPVWMNRCLREHKIELQDVSDWTSGTGPGSFTGLRLAASLVAGLCFGRTELRCRGMSSAIGMFMSLPEAASCPSSVALFDGRRGEMLAFGLRHDGARVVPSGFSAVFADSAQAREAIARHGLPFAFQKDIPAIEALLGKDAASQVRPVDRLSAAALASNDPENFGSPVSGLAYLRPAVFVEPKKPRSV